ncbi:uncharacterized protein LOC110841814 [Folsomia candida]|uniref:uncharacterized protein LOC110841814 n=1 Tax=Folsomia candida TaxID=158441 RepID=UPI000B8FDD0D|nr:uncharacterized protein LOC110841814 [Folsomia candida]
MIRDESPMSDAGGGRRGLKRRSGDQVIKGNVPVLADNYRRVTRLSVKKAKLEEERLSPSQTENVPSSSIASPMAVTGPSFGTPTTRIRRNVSAIPKSTPVESTPRRRSIRTPKTTPNSNVSMKTKQTIRKRLIQTDVIHQVTSPSPAEINVPSVPIEYAEDDANRVSTATHSNIDDKDDNDSDLLKPLEESKVSAPNENNTSHNGHPSDPLEQHSEIRLDAAVTQKFTNNLSLNVPKKDFLTPGPPPPSPATPLENMSDFHLCPTHSVDFDTMINESNAMNDNTNTYDVRDPLEDPSCNNDEDVTFEDLIKVIDDNENYCMRIYDRNPWNEYILLGEENLPQGIHVQDAPTQMSQDLENFLETMRMTPILNPEEIQSVLGVNLYLSPETHFECDRCSQKFQTSEACQEHIESGCEINLVGTSVGMALAYGE